MSGSNGRAKRRRAEHGRTIVVDGEERPRGRWLPVDVKGGFKFGRSAEEARLRTARRQVEARSRSPRKAEPEPEPTPNPQQMSFLRRILKRRRNR